MFSIEQGKVNTSLLLYLRRFAHVMLSVACVLLPMHIIKHRHTQPGPEVINLFSFFHTQLS